ncbi:MAG: type I pullulanase [Ruminococcus sp.]|nr:type I pullulanase [Ruminococcus sp.]
MFFKRLITGVMAAMMITGICTTGVTAANKKIDYQAYAAKLDETTYSGKDLGATYSKKSTTFKVWSPTADSVKVNLYEHGSDDEGDSGIIESKALVLDKKTGVWSTTVSGNLACKYYTYSVKHGKDVKETADVYAKACGVNGKRSMVVDLASTDPENWENDNHILVNSQTQATVWETSVADFSSSESSGVSIKNRGKFLAFTEEGTTVDGIQGGTSTCVDYLKKLGVKYVQIMPFYDFGSVDESKDIMSQYNWGYDPINYNCPEGSYSSNPYNGEVRIKECKQMVQALHNAGIGVIMDVVYNHTYTPESAFQYTVPNYYYRMNEDGTFSNGSGCSNDTASEHLMFRKYMIDSVTYWAKEYHIDGFRFDLMGLHDVTTMNEIRKALDNLYEDGSGKKIIMYGEGWDMPTNCDEGTVMANQKNLKQMNDRIGAFDDTIRDAIKGSNAGIDGGFIQEGKKRSNLKVGIAGQAENFTGWANVASQCVTYTSCHDNLCFYDKLVDSVVGRGSEYRKRYENIVAMNKLAGAIVLTSQGIPFMLSGEEFGRSKDGDENSYASSRELNMIDWKNLNEYSDLVEYYRGLYKIRNNFAALSDCTAMTANSISYLDSLPDGVVAYKVNNTESGKWNTMCVIFNGANIAQKVKLDGEWVVIADHKTAGLRNIRVEKDKATVEPHSALILVDKKSYDSAEISDTEGAVVIDYYDNESKNFIKTQTVTGEVGKNFDINNLAQTLNYDIISIENKKEETDENYNMFIDGVVRVKLFVEEFKGVTSSVIFKFVDENGKELIDSYAIRNRSGQQYFTPEIPSIKNYELNLSKLPDNGAGVIGDEETVVVYNYTRVTDEDSENCKVNIIYMDNTGSIIEQKTLLGVAGQPYQAAENEYEDMSLVSIPEKAFGYFEEDEINLIFSYIAQPDPYKDLMVYVYIASGVILSLCVISTIYSSISRKRKFVAEMDIDE